MTLVERRRFLQSAAALAAAGHFARPLHAETPGKMRTSDLTIVKIERITVHNPFREVPARNMGREIPHWQYSELCRVKLQSGHEGVGETLLYYTWGATRDSDVRRAEGRNAAELMWDDSLGAGLQMALFDAVARAADVPIHRLLGDQVWPRTPISWWNIDTSTEDMISECQEAIRLGYRSYKTKGRPWFDVWDQVERTSKAIPEWFHLALDFNDTLLNAERGIPILKELAEYPQVHIFETPIFQSDIPGNVAIRKATHVPVAMHYGTPEPVQAIRHQACDGFVIGGGASRVMRRGHVAAMADMPFWLQLVGTGVTAAFSLHFGAVLSHARWPAVNCHQLFQHQLLTDPIVVEDGFANVPDGPGLGYEIDWETVDRLRVAKPPRRPEPPRLIETTWPDGRRMYVANTGKVNFMLALGQEGKIPYFERGVTTRLLPDDSSLHWRELYERARKERMVMLDK